MSLTAEANPYPLLVTLEAQARSALNLAELGFSIANHSYQLLNFRQALVFEGLGSSSQLLTVSGLARPTEDSPYLIWLRSTWRWLQTQLADQPTWLEAPIGAENLPAGLLEGWDEWWPVGVFALPIKRRNGETLGWVCFLLDHPPTQIQSDALLHVLGTWSYCWEMLAGKPKHHWRNSWKKLNTRQRRWLFFGIAAFLLFPVRLTALAPAEIIALDASSVTSPLDGVVKTIHVRPNQPVKAGQALFSLDDTTLRNQLEVAQKSVAVADAELLATTQKSFDNSQSKGDLALLNGRAYEKRAELASIQAQLQRIDILAKHDGIAVFTDPDDWLGRPVTTGERIMLLASPAHPGLLIHLPVADAIALNADAPVRVFLTVAPLSPLDGKITETSYQATVSPEGTASYRLRAVFDNPDEHARIGLRGTAKIYGRWVVMGYYLLRRPIATIREWSGL